ncbi:MAG: hypothetical protein KAS32_16940, partial [Candidatus Peribacteraceae bacterium]|nr:hypothetical protein [Candidatus Peribacteraceae bacterium]
MFLGMSEILKMITDGVEVQGNVVPLIENAAQDQIDKPEGTVWDVRLDEIHVMGGSPELLLDSRTTCKPDRTATYRIIDGRTIYTLDPGVTYMVTTMEKINTPDNILPIITRRTSMFRSGIIMQMGFVAPGYVGKLAFTMYNTLMRPIQIEHGFRIASLAFGQIEGSTVLYDGVWQDNKQFVSSGERPH